MSDALTTAAAHYAHMTAAEVLERQAALLALWAREDDERRARNAALLASL